MKNLAVQLNFYDGERIKKVRKHLSLFYDTYFHFLF